MEFPDRIYTLEEFKKARTFIDQGHKHRLRIVGSPAFNKIVKQILALIRKADYYDFLRTYIRTITEIDGISQLREAEATIWLNTDMVKNIIEGARFVIQKTEQMKYYLAGEQHFEKGELPTVNKSVEFLQNLRKKRLTEELKDKCDETIRLWTSKTIL